MTHEDEALDHKDELDTQYDDLSDPERYDSAAGYESEYPHQKLLDAYRKRNPDEFSRDSMLTTKPARRWQQDRDTRKTPKAELFGPLWREGELAVLFGESGAGKSILAVQIAESIARGRPALSEPGAIATGSRQLPTADCQLPTAQNVLLVDLNHTAGQFGERYSCASPIPGKLPVRYRFSPRLHRASFGDIEIPEAFNGSFARYFEHSIKVTIEDSPAKVIIIDNLSWLCTTRNAAAQSRWLRTLKLYCATTGASILVLANSKPRRPRSHLLSPVSRLLSLNDIVSGSQIAESADSVFAIARSTYGPEYRYVKPLKSTASLVRTGSDSDWVLPQHGEVLTYQLERTTGFARVENVKRKVQSSDSLALYTVHSSLFTAEPFLGLDYLGHSLESDHLRDYAAEADARITAEANRIKRIRDPKHVVDMLTSPEYRRYLKGE